MLIHTIKMETNLIKKSKKIKKKLSENVNLNRYNYEFIVTYPSTNNLPEKNVSLENKNSINSTGIYITASPYCSSLCTYCPYSSGVLKKPSQLDEYLGALETEIKEVLKRTNVKEVTSVFFGGGTSSLLNTSQLERLLDNINTNFNTKKGSEITFEINPKDIIDKDYQTLEKAKEKLKLLNQKGVNRINLGVQTFNDKSLRAINRKHDSKQAVKAYDLIKRYFSNINIDLMFGLPYQTLELWGEDLHKTTGLNPVSITTYQTRLQHKYRVEARKTNLEREYRDHPERFPNKDETLLMRIMANEHLKEKGYQQNLACWFVKSENYDQQQQVKKWSGGNYLGFGPKAYSYIDGEVFRNKPNVKDYCNLLKKGKSIVERGKILTNEEMLKRDLIFSIKSGSINTNELKNRFGESSLEEYKTKFNELIEKRFLYKKGEKLRLTDDGMLFADDIARRFFK